MSFIKVLMVAEKPSIADVLARSLSGGRSFKGDSRIPLHEYRSTFMGQDAAFSVTSVMGHVFRCAGSDRWRLDAALADASSSSSLQNTGGVSRRGAVA